MNLEKLFQILAVILSGVAAFFLWRGNTDALFISAVLGAVAFFLSIRFQVKERMEKRMAEDEKEENGEIEILQPDALLDQESAGEVIDDEQRTTDKEQIKTSL